MTDWGLRRSAHRYFEDVAPLELRPPPGPFLGASARAGVGAPAAGTSPPANPPRHARHMSGAQEKKWGTCQGTGASERCKTQRCALAEPPGANHGVSRASAGCQDVAPSLSMQGTASSPPSPLPSPEQRRWPREVPRHGVDRPQPIKPPRRPASGAPPPTSGGASLRSMASPVDMLRRGLQGCCSAAVLSAAFSSLVVRVH